MPGLLRLGREEREKDRDLLERVSGLSQELPLNGSRAEV